MSTRDGAGGLNLPSLFYKYWFRRPLYWIFGTKKLLFRGKIESPKSSSDCWFVSKALLFIIPTLKGKIQ